MGWAEFNKRERKRERVSFKWLYAYTVVHVVNIGKMMEGVCVCMRF